MLHPTDAKNLLILLERVSLTTKEVDVYIDLRNKLRVISSSPAPGVDVGVAAPAEPTKE